MKKWQSGFSLLEILAVLVIIGFAMNLVVLTLNDQQEEQLETEALKLHTMINLASEFAVMNQLELGFHIDKNTNTFELLAFDSEKWVVITEPEVFKPHQFSEFISVEMALEDLPWGEENLLQQVDWRQLLNSEDEESLLELEKMKIPQVLLLSSGEVSPFQLVLTLTDNEKARPYYIKGELMAPVELSQELDDDA
ncbi:prepilin-type N-terminal cleavage/methylation domain-containing protein [Pseudoalteromonas spongiae]|uniref:Prepilin-type N-terminal cleavage/methylation domain-containing protein n=1 Tax=Pseudoalteromonas spongiae TaxID=298657 RepID=A0ABU8EQ20_9GAMM